MEAVCATCSLASLCLCSSLPERERRRLSDNVRLAWPMRAGEHVFRAQDAFDALFAVRSGWLKTYARRVDGDERVLGFHLPGDVLGLEAIDAGQHDVSVVALTDCRVCRIPYDAVTRSASQSPEMQQHLVRLLSRRLSERDCWLICDNLSADSRVAGFLADLVARRHRRGLDAEAFRLPMSRADIGSYLNLAHETVSRSLTRLEKNELVEVRRRKIRVLDPPGLREIRT